MLSEVPAVTMVYSTIYDRERESLVEWAPHEATTKRTLCIGIHLRAYEVLGVLRLTSPNQPIVNHHIILEQ